MITTNRTGKASEATRIVNALYQKPGLDLGCGDAPHTRMLPAMLFADLIERGNPPPNMMQFDILTSPTVFEGHRFGTVIMLDSIEHLHRLPGLKLLGELEQMADRVVIFTPLGELWLNNEEGPSGHHSAWIPEDFESMGYTTWTWPVFHDFGSGVTHGAFWAWKDAKGKSMTVEEVALIAEVEL